MFATTQHIAPNNIVEERQKQATEKAAKKGHKIGNWKEGDYNGNQFIEGRCLNRGCESTIKVSPYFNGTYVGITSLLFECPFHRNDIK